MRLLNPVFSTVEKIQTCPSGFGLGADPRRDRRREEGPSYQPDPESPAEDPANGEVNVNQHK